ncbi:MAG: 6-phosphogluconolactonase [Deltaproteobacteria bacterium]|nr:6-phosphogluconolactonase [Deltaproteobacteria bacterium]
MSYGGPLHIIVKENAAEVAKAGAELFINAGRESIRDSGAFRVALSGGATPRQMYRLLAEDGFSSQVPWEKTHLFWVDERCVPVEDERSNYGAAKRDLLDRVPIPAENVHRMPAELPPEEGARKYQAILEEILPLNQEGFAVFDLVFLGTGKDGHTASLFPGQSTLQEERRMVVTARGGEPDVDRLTLTLPVIKIIREIFQGDGLGLPAKKVAPRQGRLTWLLDREAAALVLSKENNGKDM